jgi:DNA replication protein DnaD
VEGWIELGYAADAVEIAYDKTILKTGKLAWGYMDSIIRSWHGKNLQPPAKSQKATAR